MSNAAEFREEDPNVDLLTDAEIARDWPISTATIHRQRRLGNFPEGVRIGRLRRTWRSDVRRYFEPKPRAASPLER